MNDVLEEEIDVERAMDLTGEEEAEEEEEEEEVAEEEEMMEITVKALLGKGGLS